MELKCAPRSKMRRPRCSLGSIVSPNEYIVLSKDEDRLLEVQRLESQITKEITRNEIGNCCSLVPLMWVAVTSETDDDYLKRGVIEKKLEKDLFEIFLVDYGYFVERDLSQIHIIINKDFTEIEPLAFKVKLYGILPVKKKCIKGEQKKIISPFWPKDSENYVLDLFKRNPKIIVESILMQERNIYGDLYIKHEENFKYISLRKLLCKKLFCIYSEKYFLKTILNTSSCFNNSNNSNNCNIKNNFNNNYNKNFAPIKVREVQKSSSKIVKKTENILVVNKKNNEDFSFSKNTSLPVGNKGNLVKASCGRGKFIKSVLELSKITNVVNEETKTCKLNKNYKPNLEKNVLFGLSNEVKFQNLRKKNAGKKHPDKNQKSQLEIDNFSSAREFPLPFNTSSFTKEKEKIFLEDFTKIGKLSEGVQGSFKYWSPLVIFADTVVKPVNTFKELMIEPNIIKNLEKCGAFDNLGPIQRWAIPIIRRQHNSILVGSSNTGKTLSYVVALADYVQEKSYLEDLPEGNGPRVVILGSSARLCEFIYHLLHTLLGNNTEIKKKKSNLKIVLAYGGNCEETVRVTLTNGCDVLISTPQCIVRLLEMPLVVNLERLTCLVLDEVDVLAQDPFIPNLRIVLEKVKVSRHGQFCQKIFCGKKWTPEVESLAKAYATPHALIIGSYSEAAIYRKPKPSIYFVDQKEKSKLLAEIVSKKINERNALVVCESPKEAEKIVEFLNERGFPSLAVHEQVLADRLQESFEIWESTSPRPILVATDGVLGELEIKNVQFLIHYGLPGKSKTNFFLRYSVLGNFYRTDTAYSKQDSIMSNELIDILLIDDQNHYQLPHIVDFVGRLNGKIPPKILEKCREIRRKSQIQKIQTPLCKKLLEFGNCRHLKDCSQRHVLVKSLDGPRNLPSRGWVNFLVLKCHDASHFSSRIIEHIDIDGKTTKISDAYLQISLKMTTFFGSQENRKSYGTPIFGDFCAVKCEVHGREGYFRAQIIEFIDFDKNENPLTVKVRLIDRGDILKLKDIELYELPKELRLHPPTAVDNVLAGVQPYDYDEDWSLETNLLAENLMTRSLDENQYWSGKIVLSLNGLLFLQPVMLKRFLPDLKTHVFDLIVQDELVKRKFAVMNRDHLASLFELCAEAGIEEPPKQESEKKKLKQMEPSWAFFDEDSVNVKFLAAENFSTVFLQPKKYVTLLKDLEIACEVEASKRVKETDNEVNLCVGTYCLAKFDDCWNRGRVEFERDDTFDIFFVDHGDFMAVPKKDVLPISSTLLMRLPCQAIHCRLGGLSLEQECSVEVLKQIYDFSDDGESDVFAYSVNKCGESEITGGGKYVCNLVNKHGKSLNKQLAKKEKVVLEKSEEEYLKDFELTFEESETEKENGNESEHVIDEGNSDENTSLNGRETDAFRFLLSEDLFEEEENQVFLQEFASKVFSQEQFYLDKPYSTLKCNEFSKETPFVEKAVSLKEATENGECGKGSSSFKERESSKGSKEMGKIQEKAKRKKKACSSLVFRANAFTPKVLWWQSPSEIHLKVMLGNVEDYNAEISVANLLLRCRSRGTPYAVDLRFFGAISPNFSRVFSKAFNLVVVLKKLSPLLWPRLCLDEEKQWWISWDVENLAGEKASLFSEKIQSAKRDLNNGIVKEGRREEIVRPCSDSEYEFQISDSEESD